MDFDPNDKQFDYVPTETPPPGEYSAYVSDVQAKRSKKGDPMVEVQWTIHEPGSPHIGATVREWYVLSEKAMWRYATLCRALGMTQRHDPTKQADLDTKVFGLPAVLEIENEDEEYKGKTYTRARVARVRALTPDEGGALAEAYGPGLVPNPDAGAPPAALGGEGFHDDEIPF
jgi:hypothetical protein